MSCMCGDENCKFENKLKEILNYQKIIFTPKTIMQPREIIHSLMAGVRIMNIDLSLGTKEQNLQKINSTNEGIETYQNKSELNVPITKVCTIRGRVPRTGRMRNDCVWKINENEVITLTTDKKYRFCSRKEITYVSNFRRFIPHLLVNDAIQLGKNIILLVVKVVGNCFVTCHIIKAGTLRSYEKLVLTKFRDLQREVIDKEINDCNFALEHKFDFIVVPDVRKPEYFHTIEKLVKGSDVKLIAQIESRLECDELCKIQEHFYALIMDYSGKNEFECAANKAKELQKPLIARFPTESCPSRKSIRVFEACDCFMLDCKSIETVIKAMTKLKKISTNIEKYSKYNAKLDGEEENYSYLFSNASIKASKDVIAKAMVYVTHSEKAAKGISKYCQYRYLIAFTKDESVAKRLNLSRNITPMVYVECNEKAWNDQLDEMKKISTKFALKMNIMSLSSENSIVLCCNFVSYFDEINSYTLHKIH